MDRSAVKAIVDREIEPLKARLGIPHWRIVVTYGPVSDPGRVAEGHRGMAECRRAAPYERATITLDHEQHDDETEVVDSLIHELLHVVLAPFDLYRNFATKFIEVGTTADGQEDTLFAHCIEQAVRNLERMHWGLSKVGGPDRKESPAKGRHGKK